MRRFADTVPVLRHGRVVEEGPVAHLLDVSPDLCDHEVHRDVVATREWATASVG
ncbi:hypothetical protein [Kineococcus sp. SYSU DK003]|uniref:hypothetical protein n=1 Tax=Kineococcus sp. SYSU DK003 TaxID=3383124 RepID=UPI003D7D83FE